MYRGVRRGVASIAEVVLLGIVASAVWLGIRIILAPIDESTSESNESARSPIVSFSVISDGSGGQKILACRGFSEVVTFDLEHGRFQKLFEWNSRSLQAVCVSKNGEVCLLSVEDRELFLFHRNELLKADFLTAKSSVHLALSLSGMAAIRIIDGIMVRRWDLSGGGIAETDYSFAEEVDRIALDFDGDRMLVSTTRGELHLCDAKTGIIVQTFEGQSCPKADPVFSEDGSCAVVAGNRCVTLYELPSCQPVWTVQFTDQNDQDWLTSVTISPDGRWVATSGISCPIRVVSRVDGVLLRQFSKKSGTAGIAFSSSSDVVYFGSLDGSLGSFSLVDGQVVTLAQSH
jgi:WD40 repeat protein